MQRKREIEVEIAYSDGWQERFAKAAYELFLEIKEEKIKNNKTDIRGSSVHKGNRKIYYPTGTIT